LNQLGYEAYVDTPLTAGGLWSPLLTDATKIAHYKAGKKPIVVYPEVVKGVPMGLGLAVRYVLNYPGLLGGDKTYTDGEMVYAFHNSYFPDVPRLYLPVVNIEKLQHGRLAPEVRTEIAYYHNRYSKAGGKIRDFGPDAVEISATKPDTNEKTLAILKRAKILYCYESSAITEEATLCGCAVVLLPNPYTLPKMPESLSQVGNEGLAWGESPEEVARAVKTVGDKWPSFIEKLKLWQDEIKSFIGATQAAANALSLAKAWPTAAVDRLPLAGLAPTELGARMERRKYGRLNDQYKRWVELCTLREIDADIYAEHLTLGQLPGIAVCIDHRNANVNQLADTLDSLGSCLGQPVSLAIFSESSAPQELSGDPNIKWTTLGSRVDFLGQDVQSFGAEWVLLVKSGTRIAPQGLVEWALATKQWTEAQLIYADEDSWLADGSRSYPHFKPDVNIELLRCTNYLGNAVLVRTKNWAQAGHPLSGAAIYSHALQLVDAYGKSALGHIDNILSHGSGQISAELENQEYLAAVKVLQEDGRAKNVLPQPRLGTWLVEYPCDSAAKVSLVIPSGLQAGYLRSLIESLQRFPQSNLMEIVVVTSPEQVSEVEYALSDVLPDIPLHIVPLVQEVYNHSRALNAGVAKASGEFILVCDDDTEMLHANWLTPLIGIIQQTGVGCVSPRLMANRGQDARVVGGPMVLGIGGTVAPYNGEEGRLEEAGVFSRLQLTQDVSAVAGHCFLFRRTDWVAIEGFDSRDFGLWFSVLDFCLRLAKLGRRHVWTPQSNVLHHGGKTVGAIIRDMRVKLRLADCELTEKDALLVKWAKELCADACYNRHLSLAIPFDVESNVVVDWQPRRRDRPRLIAVPLSSGAGQYRVIEPLNALQDASLAQTCVVLPPQKNVSRVLQPLELIRAAPDRLILQHSVDDAQLGLTEKYRLVMPGIEIIQMVDDLLGDVPIKHPNRDFQTREGHQRMSQALKQSDILVVTTEPLRTNYQRYVKDVRLVPNALGKQWMGLRKVPQAREKLRVGWVGAAQHKGDLDLVSEVVGQLASEVDWVFMGMCTDEIKPHLKEFHGFVSISDYPQKVSELDLDIAIAPLEANIFNECKSNLRLLEYGAMGWPVVCSDVYPYRSDDPPVIRCSDDVDEWVHALRRLIADKELRLRMGSQLHEWVSTKYVLDGMVTKWSECLLA
jgi:glycosyltransferase involved in cell wall biosynthesis